MLPLLSTATATSFDPESAFFTAFFAGIFAVIAIIFKNIYDFSCEKARYAKTLQSEVIEITDHFEQNIKRIDTIISALKDKDDIWPDRVHIIKLAWPEDSAFFNNDISKFMTVITSNNMRKFRLRIRNVNLDTLSVLNYYDAQNSELLLEAVIYLRKRTLRIIRLAPAALGEASESATDYEPPVIDYKDAKDMLFLPKKVFFPEKNCSCRKEK